MFQTFVELSEESTSDQAAAMTTSPPLPVFDQRKLRETSSWESICGANVELMPAASDNLDMLTESNIQGMIDGVFAKTAEFFFSVSEGINAHLRDMGSSNGNEDSSKKKASPNIFMLATAPEGEIDSSCVSNSNLWAALFRLLEENFAADLPPAALIPNKANLAEEVSCLRF